MVKINMHACLECKLVGVSEAIIMRLFFFFFFFKQTKETRKGYNGGSLPLLNRTELRKGELLGMLPNTR
jgi:hypothetical protein